MVFLSDSLFVPPLIRFVVLTPLLAVSPDNLICLHALSPHVHWVILPSTLSLCALSGGSFIPSLIAVCLPHLHRLAIWWVVERSGSIEGWKGENLRGESESVLSFFNIFIPLFNTFGIIQRDPAILIFRPIPPIFFKLFYL